MEPADPPRVVSPSLVNRSSPPPLPPRRITVKPKDAETGGRPRGPPGKYPSLRPTITVDRPSGILDWPNAHFFRVLAMSKCWMATGSFAEDLEGGLCNDPIICSAIALAYKAKAARGGSQDLGVLLDGLESASQPVRDTATRSLLYFALGSPPVPAEHAQHDKQPKCYGETSYLPANVNPGDAHAACKQLMDAGALTVVSSLVFLETSRPKLQSSADDALCRTRVALALLLTLLAFVQNDGQHLSILLSEFERTRWELVRHLCGLVSLVGEADVIIPIRLATCCLQKAFMCMLASRPKQQGVKGPSVHDPVETLPLDVFYGLFVPYVEPLFSSLVQLLMVSAPNVKRYSGPVLLYRELMPLPGPDAHRRPTGDVKSYHADIVGYSSAHSMLLILQWLSRGHPLQSEYALDVLTNRSAPVLILKYITQDVASYLKGGNPVASRSGTPVSAGNGGMSSEDEPSEKDGKPPPPLLVPDDILTPPAISESRDYSVTAYEVSDSYEDGDLDFLPVITSPSVGSASVSNLLASGGLRVDLTLLGSDPSLDSMRIISPTSRHSFSKDPSPSSADGLFGTLPRLENLRRRRCLLIHSLLRVLNRICRWRPERVRGHLLKFKAASVCVRCLECGFVPAVFECLKLIKLQAKYLNSGGGDRPGSQWRSGHMHVISAVYRFVGVEGIVDWLVLPKGPPPASPIPPTTAAVKSSDNSSISQVKLEEKMRGYNAHSLALLEEWGRGGDVPLLTTDESKDVSAVEVEAATGDEEGVYGDLVGVYDELAHLSGQSAEECGEGLDPGLAAHYREWLELEVPLPKPLSWLLT